MTVWSRMAIELDRSYDSTADHRHPIHEVDQVMNNRIALFEGDITLLQVDAIVNPGNRKMTKGSGISAEIFNAAGPLFESHCERVAPCKIGEAKLTGTLLKNRNPYSLP